MRMENGEGDFEGDFERDVDDLLLFNVDIFI